MLCDTLQTNATAICNSHKNSHNNRIYIGKELQCFHFVKIRDVEAEALWRK